MVHRPCIVIWLARGERLFVCCLSCPVCMEAMYRCSAMPCVPELLGGNLAPLPTDKSDWHIHQFVRVHIRLAHPSDLRLGKGCKTLLSLSLSLSLFEPSLSLSLSLSQVHCRARYTADKVSTTLSPALVMRPRHLPRMSRSSDIARDRSARLVPGQSALECCSSLVQITVHSYNS